MRAAQSALERRSAWLYRRLLGGRHFVGVTGSCAKSTTTRLAGQVLGALGPGFASGLGGNAGPHISRAVLGIRPSHRYGVQELSGHQPGALDAAIAIFQPTIGVVTWIRSDHWRAFADPGGIAEEKGKLVAALPARGTAVLNADDPVVLAMRARTRARVLTFGLAPEADVRGSDVTSRFPERLSLTVHHGGESLPLRTQLVGEHMASPVLAAVAVGLACGLSLAACVRQLEGAEGVRHRLTVHRLENGATLLLDTCKAPLWTVEASLRVLETATAKRKTFVAGTLSDYHGSASRAYRSVARRALEIADRVYFVGPMAERAQREQARAGDRELRMFPHTLALHEHLEGRLEDGDLVLLKGSSAEHLERVLEARTGPFACWKTRCGIKYACTSCRQRLTPSLPDAPGAGEAEREAEA